MNSLVAEMWFANNTDYLYSSKWVLQVFHNFKTHTKWTDPFKELDDQVSEGLWQNILLVFQVQKLPKSKNKKIATTCRKSVEIFLRSKLRIKYFCLFYRHINHDQKEEILDQIRWCQLPYVYRQLGTDLRIVVKIGRHSWKI